MNNLSIIVNEIDFCVPAQKFRFEYSTVEKGGFPFVPEFVLRLLNVSNLMPQEIATFFGFTKKELNEALRPLIDNNDIEYKSDGRVALTLQARRYFDSGSDEPLLTRVEVNRQSYIFDLLTFSPIAENEFTSSSSLLSLELKAGTEARSNSEFLAKKSFQYHFYELWQQRVKRLQLKNSDAEIYKISEVRKDRDLWARSSEDFILHIDTMQLEGVPRAKMANDEAYLQQRAHILASCLGSDNTADIALLASEFDDNITISALDKNGIDFKKLVISEFQSPAEIKQLEKRVFGTLTRQGNQDFLVGILKKHIDEISKTNGNEISELRWIAPANNFWGTSERYRSCFDLLASLHTGIDKKEKQKIINTKLYLPLSSSRDFSTARRWKAAFREQEKNLHAFIENEAIAPIEVIALSGRFALILYHLMQPDNYSVPVPFGFITEEPHKLKKIEQYINGSLSQYTESLEPRDLGQITEFLGHKPTK